MRWPSAVLLAPVLLGACSCGSAHASTQTWDSSPFAGPESTSYAGEGS